MKKVVVLALLLFVCVGSLLAQENDKRKKKRITDSLFRIDQVDVMQKKKRIDLLGLDVPLRFVPITVSSERQAIRAIPTVFHSRTGECGCYD